MTEKIRIILIMLLLAFNSICDWKYREISIVVTLSGIIFSGLMVIFMPAYTIGEVLGGIGIGIFLMICSLITKGQIGIGDGIICCFTGLCGGFSDTLGMLLAGLFFSAAVSVVLLVTKKAERKTKIPFVPFLFAGYCFVQWMKI